MGVRRGAELWQVYAVRQSHEFDLKWVWVCVGEASRLNAVLVVVDGYGTEAVVMAR